MHSFLTTTFIFFLCNSYSNFLFVLLKDSLRCFFIILFSPHLRVMCKCSSCGSKKYTPRRSNSTWIVIRNFHFLGFSTFFFSQLGGTLHIYIKRLVFSFKLLCFCQSLQFTPTWTIPLRQRNPWCFIVIKRTRSQGLMLKVKQAWIVAVNSSREAEYHNRAMEEL